MIVFRIFSLTLLTHPILSLSLSLLFLCLSFFTLKFLPLCHNLSSLSLSLISSQAPYSLLFLSITIHPLSLSFPSLSQYIIFLSITLYQLILSLSSLTLNSLHSSLSPPPFLARFLSLSLYILFHVTDGNIFKRREGNVKV